MVLASVAALNIPSNIRSSLSEQLDPCTLNFLPHTLGTSAYLQDTSSNLTRGALDVLPLLLFHAAPSIDLRLLTALKQPFDTEVLSRTPSSSHKALCIIHDYLMVGGPLYVDGNSLSLISNTTPITNGASKLFWLTKPDKMSHSLSLKNSCGSEIFRSRYADQVDLLRTD